MAETISLNRMDQMLREVFRELKAMGGQGRGRDVLAAIAPRLNLTDHEKQTTKTGAVRWDTHVRFYTTDCARAGYLQKNDGIWILTEQGNKALSLPPGELIRSANRAYRSAMKARSKEEDVDLTALEATVAVAERQVAYEKARETARAEIDAFLDGVGPYEFQNLVAELLNAMGYHVRRVAPPGADGGVDILAYRDPLGTLAPRIHVQVKHREEKVGAKEVRELEGLLRREGDIGLIVSSGGFTAEGNREIRSSSKHIDTMDQDRLISLWQEHYGKLSEEGKVLLPLAPVFFLAPIEP